MTADEFVDRVGRRADLDRDAARRAAEAVLEALADRITGGQVDDLAAQLPEALHPPLQRGKEQSNAAARPLSLDDLRRRDRRARGRAPRSVLFRRWRGHVGEHAPCPPRTR